MSSVVDRLREEYFDILPKLRTLQEEFEARIRYALIPEMKKLKGYQRIEVRSRLKDCDSAIGALQRRQEGRIFDESLPHKYTLLDLPDLAGVRILVFPSSLLDNIDKRLAKELEGEWKLDPIPSRIRTFKYYGYLASTTKILAEYQIVPMLLGLFWEVEHAAIYKPIPELRGISQLMGEETEGVEEALNIFDEKYDELARKHEERINVRRRAQYYYRRRR